jgi:Helix-turn-helix
MESSATASGCLLSANSLDIVSAQIRHERKLTQEQFAEHVGVSVDFLSLIERGINAPSFETIERRWPIGYGCRWRCSILLRHRRPSNISIGHRSERFKRGDLTRF